MNLAAPLMVSHLAREHAENLPHRAVIALAITTPAAAGRQAVTSWNPVASDVPCRLSQAGQAEREQLRADQIAGHLLYVVAFKAGTVLSTKHRLTITGTTTTPAGDVAFTHVLQVEQVSPPDRAGEFLRTVIASKAAP